MNALRQFILSAGLTAGLAFPASGQTLIHRYSFTADAGDSVGTANGSAAGGATFNGSGGVVLDGSSGYVSLPSGLVSNVTAVSIETWASFGAIANNTFLFGFGNMDAGGAGANYIFCTPHGNGTRAAITASDPGYTSEQQARIASPLDNQSNVLVTTVFNPPANFIGLYLNGVLVASNTAVSTTFASVNNKLSYIGRSLYTNDPYLRGTISEFRIFNGALTNGQIAIDAAAGPDKIVTDPGALQSLQIGTTTIFAGLTQLPVVTGNFANVSGVNLFAYGQPSVVSANANVIAVSSSGALTGIAPGTANIMVSYGGKIVNQLVTVTFATNRFIFDTFGDGFWTITNSLNGKVMTVNAAGASQSGFTNGATDQQFELLYNYQNSTFRIRQHSSWLCVGTKNGGTAAGTGVTTVNYSGAASQQWYLVDAGGGNYRILNRAGNFALQTDNGNPAVITIAPVSATSAAQLWNFSYQTHFPKKGCAGYEGSYAPFGLNWAYNYNDNTGTALPAWVNYVPMIYAAQYWEPLSDAQSRAAGWLASAQTTFLLAYNEPDNSGANGGSNTGTNDVIALWPQIQALNVPIVSPACATTYGSWMYGFFNLMAANNYRVDYTAAHMYQNPDASALIGNLQNVYNTWGRPVWLTEFSPVQWSSTATRTWSEQSDYNFLAEFMWLAEDQIWFKRYSIFPFSGPPATNPWDIDDHRGDFFLADGVTLTPYGELYATWDANRTVQTRTPYFIHNLATSFRLTSTNASAAPQASSIRVRDAATQWAFLPAVTANRYYIISLKDGRRLRNTSGTINLAPVGTTGSPVEWWFNGPDSKGYYYLDNTAAAQSIRGTGTAPAIAFSMINDPAPSTATQWRLVKPYQPVTIVTAAPPVVGIIYSNQSVRLTWSGNGSFYNVYRSLVSGSGYAKMVSATTNSTDLDSTVQNGTAYFYVVTALNILGEESAYSSEVIARPASTTLPPVNLGISGSSLQFNWPSDHVGWRLLMQTNHLASGFSPDTNDWTTVANSSGTNQVSLPLDATQPAGFYRLAYP